MAEAVYIRLYDDDLDFVKRYSKELKTDKSKIIKELVHASVRQKKLDVAIDQYRKGLKTIRESAAIAQVGYFEFFDELAKHNLLGPKAEDIDKMIDDTAKALA